MSVRLAALPFLALAALSLSGTGALAAASTSVDIGSGGPPTLTGSVRGRVVMASPTLLSDLAVTVDLGEVGPANPNPIVRVSVPIAIRSSVSYQVAVTVTSGGTSGQPLALQPSDVGFGVQNLRRLAHGRTCTNHTVSATFDNDPALTVNRAGRASFPSSLASVGASTVVLTGPRLSQSANINPRIGDNGWVFDAVFAVVPQFFAPGSTSITLTFTIRELLPDLRCS